MRWSPKQVGKDSASHEMKNILLPKGTWACLISHLLVTECLGNGDFMKDPEHVENLNQFLKEYCRFYRVQDLQIIWLNPLQNTSQALHSLYVIRDMIKSPSLRVQILLEIKPRHLNNYFSPHALSFVYVDDDTKLQENIWNKEGFREAFREGCRWLFFVTQSSIQKMTATFEQMRIFTDSNVTFGVEKANGDIELHEAYKIANGAPVKLEEVGFWKKEMKHLEIKPLMSLWQRRRNFEGLRINVVLPVLKEYPITLDTNSHSVVPDSAFQHQFDKQLLIHLGNLLNFTWKVSVFHDPGAPDKPRALIEQNTLEDIVIASTLSLSPKRLGFMDFTIPIISERIAFYIRTPSSRGSWNAFLTVFEWDTWITLIAMVPLLAMTLNISTAVYNSATNSTEERNLLDDLWGLFAAFCQKGSETRPARNSGRLIFWSGCFMFLISYIYYGSVLISFLAVENKRAPLEDVFIGLRSDEWTLKVCSWIQELFLKEPKPDTLFSDVERKASYVDCQTEFKFFEDDSQCMLLGVGSDVKDYLKRRPDVACKVSTLEEALYTDNLAFALEKHSPYTKIFNFYLLKMQTLGTMSVLRSRYLDNPRQLCPTDPFKEVDSLTALPLATLLSLGIVLAAIFFLMEITLNLTHKSKYPQENTIDKMKLHSK